MDTHGETKAEATTTHPIQGGLASMNGLYLVRQLLQTASLDHSFSSMANFLVQPLRQIGVTRYKVSWLGICVAVKKLTTVGSNGQEWDYGT